MRRQVDAVVAEEDAEAAGAGAVADAAVRAHRRVALHAAGAGAGADAAVRALRARQTITCHRLGSSPWTMPTRACGA